MKKIKIVLNTFAITLAITGAFATHFYMKDNNQSQYIPVNSSYKPVGDYGIDYNCYDSNIVCTFYLPDTFAHPKEYLPYRKGRYVPLIK